MDGRRDFGKADFGGCPREMVSAGGILRKFEMARDDSNGRRRSADQSSDSHGGSASLVVGRRCERASAEENGAAQDRSGGYAGCVVRIFEWGDGGFPGHHFRLSRVPAPR